MFHNKGKLQRGNGGNLRSLPLSAPAVDPPLTLEQPAGGGLLCCAPASLALPRRPPLPSGERPLRLRGCAVPAGRPSTEGGGGGRRPTAKPARGTSKAGSGGGAAVLGQAATVGASAGRRAAARGLRLCDGRTGDGPDGVRVVAVARQGEERVGPMLNVWEMGHLASHWKARMTC